MSEANFDEQLTTTIEAPLVFFFYFLALSSLLLRAGVFFGWTFSVAKIGIVLALPLGCLLASLHSKALSLPAESAEASRWCRAAVFALALLGGTLAVLINRPDADDSVYVPPALYYSEHPTATLAKSVRGVEGAPETFALIAFPYYEATQAGLASVLGLHMLDVYHIGFPAAVGALIVLAMFLVISIFERRRGPAVLGLLLLLLVMLCLGETHRTFGNLSIARAFQGKFMFLAAGVPAWVFFSLRYLALRRLRDWFVLFGCGIAMAAATTTALVSLPLCSGLLLGAFVLSGSRVALSETLALGAKYLSAVSPVLVLAIGFREEAMRRIGSGAAVNSGFPLDFRGQLQLLVNVRYPLTLVLFVVASVLVLLASPYRRFLTLWTVVAVVVLLNPVVCPIVMKYLTTENAYWRLFYLLPFPVIVPIAFLAVARSRTMVIGLGTILLIIFACMAIWGPTAVVRKENGATFEWPAYKIPEPERAAVVRFADELPPGSMFAPLELSTSLLTYSSKFPQMHMREDYLRFVLDETRVESEFGCRSKVYRLLYQGSSGEEADECLHLLLVGMSAPRYVVFRANQDLGVEVAQALANSGYRLSASEYGRYILFERP